MEYKKQKYKNFTSDINYHLSEIEKDLNRAKLDNNRNFHLLRLFGSILSRINLIKQLILTEPKAYFIAIHSEMKRLYEAAFGELDGFNILITFKENPKSSRMGFIKLGINKKMMKDEE